MAGSRAIGELYDAAYPRLVLQLFAICGDQVDAEDAVQEAFVTALAAGTAFDRVENPEAWLRRVALNHQRNVWRRMGVARRFLTRVPGPRHTAELGPDHVAVMSDLAELDLDQRTVIVLHHLGDQGTAEIARELDIPEGTVNSRLARGRSQLPPLLDEREGTTMPDLEILRDLTPQFPPPGLGDLAVVVRRRRRRGVLTAGAGALAVVAVVATMLGGWPGSNRSTDPTGGRTAGDVAWAPDRIRAEGDPLDYVEGRDGGLATRLWIACARANCDYREWVENYDHRVFHSAVEVTVDGYRSSGLFDLNGGGPGEWAEIGGQPFDEDSIYVQDWSRQGGTQERYRLLNADDTTTELTMLPSTAPPAAGPDVIRTTYSSSGGLARVNEAAGTIQRLDVPDAVYQWAESAADELLWGVASGCVVYWQEPGGDFAHRELECNVHPDPDPLLIDVDAPRATSWFTAERMAVIELGGSKFLPVALHVSLDRGDTWQRIPVTEDTMYDMLERLG